MTAEKYGTAFYSRKHRRWFKTYESFQKYDSTTKQRYYRENAPNLVYQPNTKTIFNTKTGKIYKKIK